MPPGVAPPRVLIHFGDAVGDDLLCTTVARELVRRGDGPVWMMTRHPALFAGNADVAETVPKDERIAAAVADVGGRFVVPVYSRHDWARDAGDPVPAAHILAVMCGLAGVAGPVTLRPYLHLTEAEAAAGRVAAGQVAMHTSGATAALPMLNKEWVPGRFQAVADAIGDDGHTVVQLGHPADPPLAGAVDLRGRTTLRQAAAVLSQSAGLVGLVGFLMHLARAVGRRSTIVYGGRELPAQSGYGCNENVTNVLPCSPCWQWSRCAYDRACMGQIGPDAVIAAARRMLGRADEPLTDETADVPSP